MGVHIRLHIREIHDADAGMTYQNTTRDIGISHLYVTPALSPEIIS